jgi:hypothetical protein
MSAARETLPGQPEGREVKTFFDAARTSGIRRMIKGRVFQAFVLGISVGGVISCTEDPRLDELWGGEMLQAPEGWVVRNPESPLETRTVHRLWSQSSDEWGEPSAVRVSGENALVLDPLMTKLYILNLGDGSVMSSFGQEGEGPGELGRLYSATLFDGAVYVSDSRTLDLSVYSLGGEYQGPIPWGTQVSQLAGWGEAGLAGIPLTQSGWVVAKGLESEGDALFIDPLFHSPYPEEEFGSCIRVTAAEGWMIRALCSALRIRVEGPAASQPFWIEHPSGPVEASDTELDEYLARFWEMESGGRELTPVVQRQLAGVRERARIRPTYSKVRIDPKAGQIVILEQPFGDHGRDPGVFHVFLLNGLYLARAETNLHIVDFDLAGDTVFVLTRNPTTHEVTAGALELRGSKVLEEEARSVPGPGQDGSEGKSNGFPR